MTGAPDDRTVLQRALMDRARAQAERDGVKPPQHVLPRVIAAALALGVVLFVLLGFNAFLTSMQKVLGLEVTAPPPAPTEPMPAYAVAEPPADADVAPVAEE
jgi:hypothetical protein